MSRVNGQVEVEQEGSVGASSRPSMEYAAEVWWIGGHSTCRKLESQMKMVRRLLEASNTVEECQLPSKI